MALTLTLELDNESDVEDIFNNALDASIENLTETISRRTPIDTGFLMTNWIWSYIDLPPSPELMERFGMRGRRGVDFPARRVRGDSNLGIGSSSRRGITAPSTIYIINNVDYGFYVNAQGRHRDFFRSAIFSWQGRRSNG